jgi:hypothetical protein
MAIFNIFELDPEDQARLASASTVTIAVPKEAYEELLRLRSAIHFLVKEHEAMKEKNGVVDEGFQRALDVLIPARWPYMAKDENGIWRGK